MSVILNHKIYNDSEWGFIILNGHAYKLLKSTILIGRHVELRNEYSNFSKNSQVDPLLEGSLRRNLFENQFNDYFIIAAAMEIYLKSKLIKDGYIVHNINKKCLVFNDLYKKQNKQPIKFSEYCIQKGNNLYKAKDKEAELEKISLKPSVLFKPKYIEVLQLKPEIVTILKMIVKTRNRIHLPTDYEFSDTKLDSNSIDVLIDFINQEIIDKTNEARRLILPNKKDLVKFEK